MSSMFTADNCHSPDGSLNLQLDRNTIEGVNEPVSNRRSFLTGRALSRQAAETIESTKLPVSNEKSTAAPGELTYLLHVTRQAMACEFTVYLNAGQHDQAAEHAVAALDLVEQLEAQLTIYRDDSEICHLNRMASEEAVTVEPRLFNLLSQGMEIHATTQGAFDLTSGPLSELWGFRRREGRLPTQEEISQTLQQVGSQHVLADQDRRTIRFAKPGTSLNLGGIGKGYALDRCQELLLKEGVGDFLIHGGHSSVLGHGSRAGRSRLGWQIDIRHPLRADRVLAEIQLHDGALGTSGNAMQGFNHQGKRYGHLLDPRTGWPAQQVISSTVLAPNAAAADALATAFYVLGVEGMREYCQTHQEISAILICPAERANDIVVHTSGMDKIDWQCHEKTVSNDSQ